MLLASLGATTATLGVVGIYRAWASPNLRRPWLRRVSWLLLAVSLVFWVADAGAEFGVAYLSMAVILMAWVAVLLNRQLRYRPERVRPSQNLRTPSLASLVRQAGTVTAVIPLAGAAAVFSSAALTLLLSWKPVNEMVLAVLLMPVLWGMAAYWLCADGRPLRPTLALIGCAGVSALALFS